MLMMMKPLSLYIDNDDDDILTPWHPDRNY